MLGDALQEVGYQARQDSKDVLDYIWLSIKELINVLKGLHRRSALIRADVGDVDPLSKQHNVDDLSEGVLEALGCVGAGDVEEMGGALKKLNEGLVYLTKLVNDIKEDHRGATGYALTKANNIIHCIILLESATRCTTPSPTCWRGTQSLLTMILEPLRNPAILLGDLWVEMVKIKAIDRQQNSHHTRGKIDC